ncbi:MAG: SDR family oxidoreductase, partial [Acinetobacter sp.]
ITQVNQRGTFQACQIIGQYMAKKGYGRIINMASLAGQNGGTATGAHYAATKGAIVTLTKIFAKEFAAKGVTVNAVAPGPMESPIVHSVVSDEKMEQFIQNIPVKALGTMHFIAETCGLLASPNAGFVTGATWDINGGLFMR